MRTFVVCMIDCNFRDVAVDANDWASRKLAQESTKPQKKRKAEQKPENGQGNGGAESENGMQE